MSSTQSSDVVSESWIEWFCQIRGHEFFCEVDDAFISDTFNLYGLRNCVSNYKECFDMLLDSERDSWDDALFPAARDLYGLIHARFILTTAGMTRMATKYAAGEFGTCPRVLCNGQPVLPMGLSADLNKSTIRLYCTQCEDIYVPPRKAHRDLDGAYFGPTFPHLLIMVKPQLFKPRSLQVYTPRVFGFKINAAAGIHPPFDRTKTAAYLRGRPRPGRTGAASGGSEGVSDASAPDLPVFDDDDDNDVPMQPAEPETDLRSANKKRKSAGQ